MSKSERIALHGTPKRRIASAPTDNTILSKKLQASFEIITPGLLYILIPSKKSLFTTTASMA